MCFCNKKPTTINTKSKTGNEAREKQKYNKIKEAKSRQRKTLIKCKHSIKRAI